MIRNHKWTVEMFPYPDFQQYCNKYGHTEQKRDEWYNTGYVRTWIEADGQGGFSRCRGILRGDGFILSMMSCEACPTPSEIKFVSNRVGPKKEYFRGFCDVNHETRTAVYYWNPKLEV